MSEKKVLAYPPEAILTREQVADWLQVSESSLKAWGYFKPLNCPGQTVRYSAGMVLAQLEGRLDAYLSRRVA